ncbi:hypothetical protein RHG08_07685 [Clostridioides difficile]|nr:hypothetical protein [Clostridioides difficile]
MNKTIFSKFMKKINVDKISINWKMFSAELSFTDRDKIAAWQLYVELITRVVTQYMEPDEGDEKAALESIHIIFDKVREISSKNGPECYIFTKLSVLMLNSGLRNFTSKWHRKLKDDISESDKLEFRNELKEIQELMRIFTDLLADICEIKDITDNRELALDGIYN